MGVSYERGTPVTLSISERYNAWITDRNQRGRYVFQDTGVPRSQETTRTQGYLAHKKPLGPYRRPMPRVPVGSQGSGRFLMSEVPTPVGLSHAPLRNSVEWANPVCHSRGGPTGVLQ